MWRKPSLADIYVHELSTTFDKSLIPLFTPDTVVEVGTTGRFMDGRFESSGLLPPEVMATITTTTSKANDWSFSSEGAVNLKAHVDVPGPPGQQLVKGELRFTRDRAVVAAFKGVTEVRAASDEILDNALWPLYVNGRLDPDEVVVWWLRRAASGAVLVNRKSGVNVELIADASIVSALSLQALAAGVGFGSGTQASFQLAGKGLVPFVRVKGLSDDLQPRIENVRRFEADSDELLEELGDSPVPSVSNQRVLAEADFDTPEDETD